MGWMVLAAVTLLGAGADSDQALDDLRSARRQRTFSAVVDPVTSARLGKAQDGFASAHDALDGPVLAPVRLLPVLGRQIRASARLDGAAAEATGAAREAVDQVRDLTSAPAPAGPERVRLLRRLADVVTNTRQRLAAVDPGEGKALAGPLRDARAEFLDARAEATDGLERAGSVLDGAANFLDRSDYLLLAANNAEMRAGSGMFLSAGDLDTSEGRVSVGTMGPTNAIVLADGVPTSGDLPRNWPWLDPGRDFRNLGLTPQFPVSAEIASRMWPRAGGRPVEGVMAVDVDALRSLLEVVGPVTVDGVTYAAPTVRGQLLNRQYRQFDGDQQARTDVLGEVAAAVLGRLDSGGWQVDELATALVEAVQGRHLLAWSSDPVQQRGWEAAGAAGELTESTLSITTLNRSANKLDWFVDADTTVTTESVADGTDVRVETVLRNDAPTGQPKYVAGPNAPGLDEGDYSAVVLANVPRAATGIRFSGGEYDTLAGLDGPTQVRGRYVRIPRGGEAKMVLTFHLPRGVESMVIEPSARVKPMKWSIDGVPLRPERRHTVDW